MTDRGIQVETSATHQPLSSPVDFNSPQESQHLAKKGMIPDRRGRAASKSSPFKYINNKRHHAYPANEVPYPRNYEYGPVDRCASQLSSSIRRLGLSSAVLPATFGRACGYTTPAVTSPGIIWTLLRAKCLYQVYSSRRHCSSPNR